MCSILEMMNGFIFELYRIMIYCYAINDPHSNEAITIGQVFITHPYRYTTVYLKLLVSGYLE